MGKGQFQEKEYANGRSCEGRKCPASWIEEGTDYVFTLYDYSTGSRGAVLASVGVKAEGAPGVAAHTAGPSGTIQASPNPCRIPPGKMDCTVYVTWSAEGVQHARVYVTAEGKKTIGEKEFASSRSCEGQQCPASWIEAGALHVHAIRYFFGHQGARPGERDRDRHVQVSAWNQTPGSFGPWWRPSFRSPRCWRKASTPYWWNLPSTIRVKPISRTVWYAPTWRGCLGRTGYG